VIDLHCHILPGLDDGAATIDESVVLARAFKQVGIDVAVATPHIREDHPFDPAEIGPRARGLEEALAGEGIELRVVAGAEVAISRVRDLSEETLRTLCLGDGPYMLVESPYTHATTVLEDTLFDLQVQGFRPVLAHPERAPSFQQDLDRLARLVDRGVLCSVTAASMIGTFGGTVREFTALLFQRGFVHNVASDAHNPVRRPIDLLAGFEVLDRELPGLADHARWFTVTAPQAILAGSALPPLPEARPERKRGLRRLLGG
jgi:protein-tyrosine phosphatase